MNQSNVNINQDRSDIYRSQLELKLEFKRLLKELSLEFIYITFNTFLKFRSHPFSNFKYVNV